MSDTKEALELNSLNDLQLRPKDVSVKVSIQSSGAQDSSSLEQQTRTRKLFSLAHLFAFSLSYMSTWGAVLALSLPARIGREARWELIARYRNMYYALYNGGPRTFLITYIIALLGALGQSASLSEMASIQPIAGAQYHWTWALSVGKTRRIATWIQGWTTWFAYVSIIAGCTNINVIVLEAMISMNNPNYVTTGWKTAVISIGLSIFQGFLNTHAFQMIPWIEVIAGILYGAEFIIFIVVLGVMGVRNPASFIVSTNISSGWTNSFIASNVGMLTAIWCFTGHEGVIHMGEEARASRTSIPKAAFWSLLTNGCIGFVMLMVVLVAMGDIDDVLSASMAIQEILLKTTGSTAATTAMMAGMFINGLNVTLASIASTSRLTWAWARDGGLPGYFAHVAPRQRVPVRAVVLVTAIDCLLCLLNVNAGAYVAYGAIAALCGLACYISYAIAVGSMLHARWDARRGRRDGGLRLGEWSLGRWGVWVNAWALAYTCWAIVFLPFPSTIPVTAANMNYSGPIMGLVLLLALVLWFARARKHWQGPNVHVIDIVLAKSEA